MEKSMTMVIVLLMSVITLLVLAPLIGKIKPATCNLFLGMGVHSSYTCSKGYYKDMISNSPDAYKYYEQFLEYFGESKDLGDLDLECEGYENLVNSMKENNEEIINIIDSIKDEDCKEKINYNLN